MRRIKLDQRVVVPLPVGALLTTTSEGVCVGKEELGLDAHESAPEGVAELRWQLHREVHEPIALAIEPELRERLQEELDWLALNGHRRWIRSHAVDRTDGL